MKTVYPLLLTLLSLTGCKSTEYALVTLPTGKTSFLSDYKVSVLDASFYESASLRPETPDQELVLSYAPNGKQYLNVVLEFTRFVTVDQSPDHSLDENDFKIKDHTDFGASNYFSTVKSQTDYTWKSESIEPGNDPLKISLFFELGSNINFSKNLIVLEVDFFNSLSDGVDVPLTTKVA